MYFQFGPIQFSKNVQKLSLKYQFKIRMGLGTKLKTQNTNCVPLEASQRQVKMPKLVPFMTLNFKSGLRM